ncbi:universal stress protein [Amphritea sp. 2_MG-2023]|uniref:universal stress protein n=1 Tax=Amphritea TaxID=515417 RepID=UPI001C067939|nr:MULTISPECIES: universal stress protein [Amphritea]MBU2965595.1 universal stress protein [Amphritea atlantica]MDO6418750.1 universal stress protein [Amphritea sp. 2_MG-2023]MDX2424099.1 universal stress protein [Amphritea sp.]
MFTNILIPLDLSHKEQVVELAQIATKLAEGKPAQLNLLYVDQSFVHGAGDPQFDKSVHQGHRKEALEAMENLLSDLPDNIQVKSLYRDGTAHDQILATAKQMNSDVIVMMARKPGISSYFIGSNAERVVRHAPCSVFIVRTDESDS